LPGLEWWRTVGRGYTWLFESLRFAWNEACYGNKVWWLESRAPLKNAKPVCALERKGRGAVIQVKATSILLRRGSRYTKKGRFNIPTWEEKEKRSPPHLPTLLRPQLSSPTNVQASQRA
jgi:hypothetical protein